MNNALDLLAGLAGQYRGNGQLFVREGINLGGTFLAFLEVQPGNLSVGLDYWQSGALQPVPGPAIKLLFRSVPQDRSQAQQELSIVTYSADKSLRMWQERENAPPLIFELGSFEAYDEGELKISFGCNPDPAQPLLQASYTFESWPDGTASYSYNAGQAADFKPRWAARMQRSGKI